MPLPMLTVKLDGPTGRGAVVALDGHDISAGLTACTIDFRHDDITRATLEIACDGLELDAQTLAILAATVKVVEPEPAAIEPPEMRCFGEEPAHA